MVICYRNVITIVTIQFPSHIVNETNFSQLMPNWPNLISLATHVMKIV